MDNQTLCNRILTARIKLIEASNEIHLLAELNTSDAIRFEERAREVSRVELGLSELEARLRKEGEA